MKKFWANLSSAALGIAYLPTMVICDDHPKFTRPFGPQGRTAIPLRVPDFPANLRTTHPTFQGEIILKANANADGRVTELVVLGGSGTKERDLFALSINQAFRSFVFPRDWPGEIHIPVAFTADPCRSVHFPKPTPKPVGPEPASISR